MAVGLHFRRNSRLWLSSVIVRAWRRGFRCLAVGMRHWLLLRWTTCSQWWVELSRLAFQQEELVMRMVNCWVFKALCRLAPWWVCARLAKVTFRIFCLNGVWFGSDSLRCCSVSVCAVGSLGSLGGLITTRMVPVVFKFVELVPFVCAFVDRCLGVWRCRCLWCLTWFSR